MLIMVLAWMSIQASVTLSTLLTVIFLPIAILKARKSMEFALMTVAMILMLWRGEAWKAVFLQSEQQVLELQRQPRQPSEPSAISFDQGERILRDDVHCVLPRVLPQSLVEAFGDDHR
jgi:hypothetical protein